ncbi:di-trans,poly-cis-decaprenylcistransferase [Candidatus Amesbacteria bacterium RIFCSPHIGHO2_01_FULL_48_32]|uniref:Isoprenyl transferase n=1 Tax=Candidatus Amesbacteria bacterium RIFCSPLOWO2_01_FULL_48_25 TaxID=1797259 RepID=A0A1F4ZF88_9BACT|nr:MAG: di-trans,poly-cis-decaprenylcistransferase [Candidatus Amesbacteria bacterium RIFCSPHIGHO2_01_FULL_48_32]OGD04287.1 MAG: di-trans,poly-cis-decaprenylcistransferase [Candidatus Amesbacteria bacterium RIFCSPLOWO2_01_FULL_48_25]
MAKAQRITISPETKVPDHIALILDGNRRWARARGMHTFEGHKAGFEAGMRVAQAARDWGVHTFTVWGFSTENWDRSKEEIELIMALFWKMVDEVRKRAKREGIRFVHLGRKDRFSRDLVSHIAGLEEETRDYNRHVFNAALDYGGHDEIVRATNKILKARLREVDEKTFEKYLDTGDQPYPYVDLFIRTSGEQRTSGLMPWQMHYAEYYWELDHLPDFTPEKLREAILDYSRRRRRFGGNDAEAHLKFDPKVVARLEMDWRRELTLDKVVKYVREQYGLSKDLAKTAGEHFASALVHRDRREWQEAKLSLIALYGIVKRNLGLAFEPEIIANFEVNLWKNGESEDKMREFLGEKYRFSELQAAKSAHLAVLAGRELDPDKARGYLERFYRALKERVA